MRVARQKNWITSADEDVLRFSVPPQDRRDVYALVVFFVFVGAMFLWLSFLEPLAAGVFRRMIPADVLLVGILVYASAPSGITINVKARTYALVSRWPWGTRVRSGPLGDFRAVYVSDQGHVSLVFRRAWPRQIVPLGSAGFGGDGFRLAQEVGRRIGLEVVRRL